MDTSDTPVPQPPQDAAPPQAASSPAPAAADKPSIAAPTGADATTASGGHDAKAQTDAPSGTDAKADSTAARDAFFAKWKPADNHTPSATTLPDATPGAAETQADTDTDTDTDSGTRGTDDDDGPITNDVAAKDGIADPSKFRRKYNKMREKLAEAEGLADLGTDILTTCAAIGWTPQQYVQTMQLHAAASKGDPKALEELRRLVGGASPAPAAPAWTAADDDWLVEQVANGDMSKDAAKALRSRYTKAAATPAPAPAPQAPAPQPQRSSPPPPPAQGWTEAQAAAGRAAITKARADALAGLSDVDRQKIDAEAAKLVAQHKGSHPDAWGAIVRSTIQGVIARHKAAAQNVPIRTTARPSTTATAPAAPKTAREAFEAKWYGRQ